jgi:hypothetical protein
MNWKEIEFKRTNESNYVAQPSEPGNSPNTSRASTGQVHLCFPKDVELPDSGTITLKFSKISHNEHHERGEYDTSLAVMSIEKVVEDTPKGGGKPETAEEALDRLMKEEEDAEADDGGEGGEDEDEAEDGEEGEAE